jgi:hypothetical protein
MVSTICGGKEAGADEENGRIFTCGIMGTGLIDACQTEAGFRTGVL